MKMFRTVNMDVINDCRLYFDFMLPSELLRKFNSCYSSLPFWLWEMCVTIIYYLLVKLIKFFPFLFLFLFFLFLSFYILLATSYGE